MQTVKTCQNLPELGTEFKSGDRAYVITRNDSIYILWQFSDQSELYFRESCSGLKSMEEFFLKNNTLRDSKYIVQKDVYEHGDRIEAKGKVTRKTQYCAVVQPRPNSGQFVLVMDNGYIYRRADWDSNSIREVFSEEAYEIRVF